MRWAIVLAALLAGCSGESEVERRSIPLIPVAYAETLDTSPSASRPFKASFIREARLIWGLRWPLTLASQIGQESAWNPNATSRVGAKGLGQFMDTTAEYMGRSFPELGPASQYNPEWSLRAHQRYMRDLWNDTQPMGPGSMDACSRIAFATVSYNQGPGNTIKDRRYAQQTGRDPNRWFGQVALLSAPGRASWAHAESRGYVANIVERQRTYAAWGGQFMCAEVVA